MVQKFQKLISVWIYLVIKNMFLPNWRFHTFHQLLNQKLLINGVEVKEKFFSFRSLHLSPDASKFFEKRPSISNFPVVGTQSPSSIKTLFFSIRSGSRKLSLLCQYTEEILYFSVCVGFPMVPKTIRTLFASKLLVVHTLFLRYCILYFSHEVVNRKFLICGEKRNPKTYGLCLR